MNPNSCLICKKGKTDILTRCGHSYHEQCLIHRTFTDKRADCLVCGGPVSYVQQLEDLKSGSVTFKTILDKKSGIDFDEEVLLWGIENNDVDLVREIDGLGIINMNDYFTLAAECGTLEVVKYLMTESDGFPEFESLSGAIDNGHIEVVKFIVESGQMDCGSDTISSAVYSGNLEIVKYLIEDACLECDTEPLEVAAEQDHLDILTYLISKGAPCSEKVVYEAAENGNLKIIEYLLSKKAKFSASAIRVAASNGHHDVVKLLKKHLRAKNTKTSELKSIPLKEKSKHQ